MGSKRVWRTIGLLAFLLGLYTLLGFVVLPKVLRSQATTYVWEHYGRKLQLGEIRAHPFKLYVEIRDVALPDADGALLIGFDRIFVDFQAPSSVWERSWVFREISLERPRVRLVRRADASINLADLVPREKPGPEAETGDVPALWIRMLSITNGQVEFLDHARAKPFQRSIAPLSFELMDFRTSSKGGEFALSADGEDGASVRWKGKVALLPEPRSEGRLTLSDLPLRTLAEYLEGILPVSIPRGRLKLVSSYRVQVGRELQAEANVAELRLSDVALQARGVREPWLRMRTLVAANTHVSLPAQRTDVERVTVSGAMIQARLEPDGSMNLTRMFSSDAGSKVESNPGPSGSVSSPWSVSVGSIELEKARVDFEDAAIAPGTHFKVTPLNVSLRGVSLDLDKPVAFSLEAHVADDGGSLRLAGELTPSPLAGEIDVAVARLRLSLAQPYVAQYASLTVRNGALGVDGKLRLEPRQGENPKLSFAGSATVSDLRTVDHALRQDFVNVKRLTLKGVRYATDPEQLSIKRIDVDRPYARVVLSEAQVLNVAEVLQPKAKRPSQKPEHEAKAPQAPERPVLADQGQATPIRIDTVRINRMRLNFADHFVEPDFAADIHSLSGTLRGLSSNARSSASVSLVGKLGENSPVTISGRIQPFAYDKFTDLSFRSENIELAVFNPYSGRFAGYNIARGELTTDLHYVVRDRKLSAEHHIRIDQLAWGEATATKAKAPLPVKLATVLLRDRHGVISLDVPLNGSLDDPEFRVWPIVWQVIKNIIVKAATAPFDLLASLFQGADKAKYIDFAPGDAALDPGAKEGLNALTKAMVERPQLKLDVPVGAVPALDRAALVERKYQQRVQTTMQSALSKRERQDAASFAELSTDGKREVLVELYEELAGKRPDLPEAPPPGREVSRREARALRKEFEVGYLERAARAKIAVEDVELEALARRRGEIIERALLASGKVEPSRVLLSQRGKVRAEQGKVRVELGFE